MSAPEGWIGPDWDTLPPHEQASGFRKMAFLKGFATTGIMKSGCDAAGVSRTAVKQWRELPWFEEAYQAALEEANDLIENELHRRAVHGVNEPITYQGQPTWIPNPHDPNGPPVMFTIKKYSDSLMPLLMKARKPQEYGDKSKVQLEGAAVAPVLILPGVVDADAWAKAAAEQQAKYAGNTEQGEDK